MNPPKAIKCKVGDVVWASGHSYDEQEPTGGLVLVVAGVFSCTGKNWHHRSTIVNHVKLQ